MLSFKRVKNEKKNARTIKRIVNRYIIFRILRLENFQGKCHDRSRKTIYYIRLRPVDPESRDSRLCQIRVIRLLYIIIQYIVIRIICLRRGQNRHETKPTLPTMTDHGRCWAYRYETMRMGTKNRCLYLYNININYNIILLYYYVDRQKSWVIRRVGVGRG